jgi:hypothetical protein
MGRVKKKIAIKLNGKKIQAEYSGVDGDFCINFKLPVRELDEVKKKLDKVKTEGNYYSYSMDNHFKIGIRKSYSYLPLLVMIYHQDFLDISMKYWKNDQKQLQISLGVLKKCGYELKLNSLSIEDNL